MVNKYDTLTKPTDYTTDGVLLMVYKYDTVTKPTDYTTIRLTECC